MKLMPQKNIYVPNGMIRSVRLAYEREHQYRMENQDLLVQNILIEYLKRHEKPFIQE